MLLRPQTNAFRSLDAARAFSISSCAPAPPPPPRHRSSHGSISSSPPPPDDPIPSTSNTYPPALSTDLVLSPPPPLVSGGPVFPSSFSPPRDPQLPFSTQTFIRKLERRSEGTIGRGMATVIMAATRDMLEKEEDRVGREGWRRGDLENKAYLFHAAMTDVKTSAQVKSRNDSVVLRSMTASLQRDTHAIGQRMKEDMDQLRSEIQLEMASRKEESNADLKALDRAVGDLNSKFTILLGEARTEMESLKWVSTRRVMSTLSIIVVGVVGAVAFSSPSEKETPSASAPLTVEQLGLETTSGTEADVAGQWFWNGTAVAGRVDGEAPLSK